MLKLDSVNKYFLVLLALFLVGVFAVYFEMISRESAAVFWCKMSFWTDVCATRVDQGVSISTLRKDLNREWLRVKVEAEISKANDGHDNVVLHVNFEDEESVGVAYVSIYNPANGEAVYDYSTLKTNQDGVVSFSVPDGTFDLIIGNGISPDCKKQFYLAFSLEITSKVAKWEKIFTLAPFAMKIEPLPEFLPEMKVEAVMQREAYLTPSQLFARIDKKSGIASFWVTPGIYNFNFDTLRFYAGESMTYALAVKNIHAGWDTEAIFLSKDFKKDLILIEEAEYAWFKLISEGTGDFQSMYFGKPVAVVSNLQDLKTSILYIPSQACVRYWREKYLQSYAPDQAEPLAIDRCNGTNIRYDTSAYSFDGDSVMVIQPPDAIVITMMKDLPYYDANGLHFGYGITTKDGDYYTKTSIHHLWETDIKPRLKIYNDRNEIIKEISLFGNDSYFSVKERRVNIELCLPVGSYVGEMTIPGGTWVKEKISGSFSFQVTSQFVCGSKNRKNSVVEMKIEYENWMNLYEERFSLATASSTLYETTLTTYSPLMSLNLDINFPKVKEDDCGEWVKIAGNDITVSITNMLVEDRTMQGKLVACVNKLSGGNPDVRIFLEDRFWGNSSFPTSTKYIFYYFYLMFKEQFEGRVQVGIKVNNFYQFFYGYFDIYLIPEKVGEFYGWIDQYPGLIDTARIVKPEQ